MPLLLPLENSAGNQAMNHTACAWQRGRIEQFVQRQRCTGGVDLVQQLIHQRRATAPREVIVEDLV